MLSLASNFETQTICSPSGENHFKVRLISSNSQIHSVRRELRWLWARSGYLARRWQVQNTFIIDQFWAGFSAGSQTWSWGELSQYFGSWRL